MTGGAGDVRMCTRQGKLGLCRVIERRIQPVHCTVTDRTILREPGCRMGWVVRPVVIRRMAWEARRRG